MGFFSLFSTQLFGGPVAAFPVFFTSLLRYPSSSVYATCTIIPGDLCRTALAFGNIYEKEIHLRLDTFTSLLYEYI